MIFFSNLSDGEILCDCNSGCVVTFFFLKLQPDDSKKRFWVVPVCPNYPKKRVTMSGESNYALHKGQGYEMRDSWSSLLALLTKLYTHRVIVTLRVAFVIPCSKWGNFSNLWKYITGANYSPTLENCFQGWIAWWCFSSQCYLFFL